MNYPFTEQHSENGTRIRTFSHETDPEELVWHRDDEDRTIKILECDGWYFQRDDELPIKLSIGDVVRIPKGQWHRVMSKRISRLIVEIISNSQFGL